MLRNQFSIALCPLLLVANIAIASEYMSYGGGFQVDDCNRNNVNNPITGTLSCPWGTWAYWSGRARGPESRCGSNQYMCLGYGYSQSGSWGFGGMFQIDDCGRNNVGNSLYWNWLACPTGFGAYRVARVTASESKCGATQYACISPYGGSQWATPAGTFQIDDCATNNRPNPFSGGLYCPPGHYARPYGRVKGSEGDKCGVWQYVCTSW